MTKTRVNRRLLGVAASAAACAVLVLVLMAARAHVPSATCGLALVLPVLVGVVVGGAWAGLFGLVAGFVAYDYFFIPPYGSLTVGRPQDLVTLAVYALVMAIVARVVSGLDRARDAAALREADARHLLGLSELLLAEKPPAVLGAAVTEWARLTLKAAGASLFLAEGTALSLVATAGRPLSPSEAARLQPHAWPAPSGQGSGPLAPEPLSLSTGRSGPSVQALALASAGKPVGLLVLQDLPASPTGRELLPTLANHLAVALERAQLSELALRSEVLEEVERLRRSLMGAVSHDLRNPLATIKVASSALLAEGQVPSPAQARELYALIDAQADRLTRLVKGLLDMTRAQAGALEVRCQPCPVNELISGALEGLGPLLEGRTVKVCVPAGFPDLEADALLVGQVLANLVENANRFGPPGSPITVAVRLTGTGLAELSVEDEGPGVAPDERVAIFERFARFDTGGRSGLGLAIVKAFVEAHRQAVWVESAPSGGARFAFTLALARPTGVAAAVTTTAPVNTTVQATTATQARVGKPGSTARPGTA